MRFSIRKQAAFLLLSFVLSSPVFGEPSCEDARLKETFKPELTPQKAELDCRISNNATAPFGLITIKDSEGKELKDLSCCAATRLLAFQGTEKFLEHKRIVCARAQASLPGGNCSGAHCLRTMEQFYEAMEGQNAKLADHAKEARRVGAECRKAFAKMKSMALSQMATIASEVQRAPAAMRPEMLRAGSLRTR